MFIGHERIDQQRSEIRQVSRKTSRLTVTCFLFAAVLLALAIYHWPVRQASPNSASIALPALQGTAAVEHLKQQGLYDSLNEAMTATRYSLKPVPEAQRIASKSDYVADNPEQQLRTSFAADGLELQSSTQSGNAWRVGMKLRSVGYGNLSRKVGSGAFTAQGNRIEYERPVVGGQWAVGSEQAGNDQSTIRNSQLVIKEWYLNTPTGLEQGFTLSEPPGERRAGEPLRLALALESELQVQAEGDGQAVEFMDAAGNRVLRYDHLAVWDACGQKLAARMSINRKELRLEVDDAAAAYPVTIDPNFTQQAYLKASNTGGADIFGNAVSVSGDTVVVGAYQEDSNATGVNGNQADNSASNSGAAYVFVRSGVTWSQQAYLKASNTEANDHFGYSVAVSGDTVVVGADNEDSNATGVNGSQGDNSAADSGAAYVFVRSGVTWSQQAYLKASNTRADDWFGLSVAVSGDTVVVGALFENSNATGVNGNQGDNSAADAGAAYVFVRSGVTWSQQAYFKASNTGANDRFGQSVAVSGDTVVVGAWLEDSNATGVNGNQGDNSVADSGAAYVFVRSGVTWGQQAYLKASNTGASDGFGYAVAVSGDTVVVGAWVEASNATGVNGNQADNSASLSGAAYVFVRGGVTWSQQAYLKASNTGASDRFGYSVSVSGDTVVVGAYQEDSNATGVNGNQADNSASTSGAAYVFVRSDMAWSQQAYLKASNTGANDELGISVSVSGDTVVAGADGEASNATGVNGNQADNSVPGSGAVYVFFTPPPVLGNYANTSVQLSGSATVTPDAAPTNTTNINVSTSINFKGQLEGVPATGVVRITDAHPAGTYAVTVTAFDSGGVTTTKTFTLTVTTPTTCNPVSFLAAANFGAGSNPNSVAVGDFNGDGKQDIVTANLGSNNVSVLLGDGVGSFSAAANFGVGVQPASVAVGDFNNDGKKDIVTANFGATNVSVLLGDGAGSFSAAATFGAGSAPISVAVGDFNGDGKQDLAVVNRNSANVSVLLGDGAGSFSAATNFGVGTQPAWVAIGDFNGDGKQDLAVANISTNNVSVLLGNGAGSFSAATNFASGTGAASVAVGDFNADGKQDLAVANLSSANVSVLLGDGVGSFGAAANFTIGNSPRSVVVGDFNGDGKQDLVVANSGVNNVSVLLGDNTGSFSAATNVGVSISPSSVAVGDFNGDNKQDLATANSGNVSVLLRQCAPTITAAGALTRQQGSTGTSSTVATVNDAETAVGSLTVTATSVPTGLTVTGITNTSGTITATVAASCTATVGANTVVLQVSDGTATATANLTVNVTANTAPTLTYSASQLVAAGAALMINPATGPGDNGTINTIVVQSQGTYTGTISVNNSTGVVSISGAKPGGDHFITITATDNCLTTTSSTFTLTVNCPAIAISPTTLANGTTGISYNQTLTAAGGASPYAFTVIAGTLPSGLTLATSGSLTGTPTTTGIFSFTVKATDNNGCMRTRVYTLLITCATIAPATQFFPVSGGSGMVTVTGPGGCAWTATSDVGAPWIHVTGGASGNGNGTVSYSIDANPGTTPRVGKMTIASNTFIVSQAATGVLVYTDFTVATPGDIPLGWTVEHFGAGAYQDGSPASWTTGNPCNRVIPPPFSGGFAIVDASCANPGATFDEQLITPSFNATGVGTVYVEFFNRFGGIGAPNNIGDVEVSINGGVSWLAPPVHRFQNVDDGFPTPVTSSFDITPFIAANPANVKVRLHYTGVGVASLRQPASPESQEVYWGVDFSIYYYALNPTSQNFSASGGSGNASVSTSALVPSPQGAWTATSNAAWITLAAQGGTGNGSIGYIVAANSTASPRTGTVTIAGNTFTVTQNACTPATISPATLSNGFVSAAYNQTLTASSGVAPYTFSVSAGALPNGLTLSSGGVLSGTPTTNGTFSFTVKTTDGIGCMGTQNYTVIISGDGPNSLVFYPLPRPVRLLDTRAGAGNCDNVGTPITGGSSLTTLARLTCEGITIPASAKAITGNLTVINQTAQTGYLTIYPDGQGAPLASNMIYEPNGILSNNFTVGLSADGKFNVFGERTIDVVVDISGYYAPPVAGGLYYHPLSKPVRLLDTRPGQGNCDSVGTSITGGTSITTLARGSCDGVTIPTTAQAIVGNATVINGSGLTGYLTIYPNGVTAPLAANLIYFPGQIISNAFTVSLNVSGEFNVFGERTIDIAIDVAGYYSSEAVDANGAGLLLTPLARPLRILDTRPAQGNCDAVSTPITGGTSIATAGRLTCDSLTIPASAQSILGNVTVVNQTASAGYLTLYPDGVTQPLVANMIYFPNQILSNAFVVGLNSGTGQFRIFAERTLDAIVDVSGFFAP